MTDIKKQIENAKRQHDDYDSEHWWYDQDCEFQKAFDTMEKMLAVVESAEDINIYFANHPYLVKASSDAGVALKEALAALDQK